jgi:hypothetical protein
MAYTRGSNANIIVGAAALFTYEAGELTDALLPVSVGDVAYRETLSTSEGFRNVGYTMNGLELQFQPDFGEVTVDQILDVAKLYKQGMKVNLNTTFVESTLENLLVSLARPQSDAFVGTSVTTDAAYSKAFAGEDILNLASGELGECPVERGLIAIGPGTGDCAAGSSIERIYVAYRALSIENVTVSAKRDAATMFEVSFRLLPNNSGGYGKIVDRTLSDANKFGFPS